MTLCFSDTDIIVKLCAIDLLEDALETFGVTHREVYLLRDELAHAASNPDLLDDYPPDALNRAVLLPI